VAFDAALHGPEIVRVLVESEQDVLERPALDWRKRPELDDQRVEVQPGSLEQPPIRRRCQRVGLAEGVRDRHRAQGEDVPASGVDRKQEPVVAVRSDQVDQQGRREVAGVGRIAADVYGGIFDLPPAAARGAGVLKRRWVDDRIDDAARRRECRGPVLGKGLVRTS
jgi:hypothetical protein